MKEFQWLDWVRQQAESGSSEVTLGIGDDAAIIRPPPGQEMIVTTDTLVADVHFFSTAPADSVGHKSLAVNLSDLAAMGAKPNWVTLSLTLPSGHGDWARSFLKGFLALAGQFEVKLIGGDTTAGPLAITVTAIGTCPYGQALRRDGARAGDLVVVSGTVGDAAYALSCISNGAEVPNAALQRLQWPSPRLELGQMLRSIATSCIDISDGLAADLKHICAASDCRAELDVRSLFASSTLKQLPTTERWVYQLAGGDDYELCFTIPAANRDILTGMSEKLGIPLTVIGQTKSGSGVLCFDGVNEVTLPSAGYEHVI